MKKRGKRLGCDTDGIPDKTKLNRKLTRSSGVISTMRPRASYAYRDVSTCTRMFGSLSCIGEIQCRGLSRLGWASNKSQIQ